jgi:hypothetical protein
LAKAYISEQTEKAVRSDRQASVAGAPTIPVLGERTVPVWRLPASDVRAQSLRPGEAATCVVERLAELMVATAALALAWADAASTGRHPPGADE